MPARRTWLVIPVMVVGAALCAALVDRAVFSGELEPPGPPGPTMHSLDEIHAKLATMGSADGRTVPPVDVSGAAAIHMSITGETAIQGSCEAEMREGTIVVAGLAHQVYLPYDSDTGQVTGARKHEPLSVLKGIDKSSPLLYQALVNGSTLDAVQLSFYRFDPGVGLDIVYYTVTLTDARIVSIQPSFPNWEEVTFIYQQIGWHWLPDSVEFEDELTHPTAKE